VDHILLARADQEAVRESQMHQEEDPDQADPAFGAEEIRPAPREGEPGSWAGSHLAAAETLNLEAC